MAAQRAGLTQALGAGHFMAGKFLKRGALVDIQKSEERTNAQAKREGLDQHPVRLTVCGCPDPNCGGWHTIVTDRVLPSAQGCVDIIKEANHARKRSKPRRA